MDKASGCFCCWNIIFSYFRPPFILDWIALIPAPLLNIREPWSVVSALKSLSLLRLVWKEMSI